MISNSVIHLTVIITECGRNGGFVITSTLSNRKWHFREIEMPKLT